ncbi:BamA/TamA family outer membrane protein [Roseivirga seohaensis]|uniref:BamA/TamA family outer membrane protein n=1 Tax=Roseivirga seohaensis TaxID=1914963 RepID=UPI00069F37AE|nr:BamA/TamA family outer membrane protein [Roseivirga seohaensis]
MNTTKLTCLILLILMVNTTKAQTKKDTVNYQTAIPNSDYYERDGLWRFLWGDHYRKEWATPINVPVFEPTLFKGGVEVLQIGGGYQTKSLRLLAENGIQYNLRSLDKYPYKVLPEALRGTWLHNILKDQISSAHPYAFMAIPKMADAVGVYHTKPEILYVRKSTNIPGYEDFLEEFGDALFMAEIRPDEDLSNYERFGNSKNIVGTDKLFEHLYEDNDNFVDERQLAKSRLFDMLIGDWDRHWDQWRWAEFENEDKGSRFEAVPRDRDQAFVLMDGLLPSLIKRPTGKRELSHFTYEIENIRDINYAGRHVDRNLLTRLEKKDWIEIAKDIQRELTDEIIHQAMQDLPPEVYSFSAQDIEKKLISRRNELDKYAEDYYLFLSKFVRIVGSNKHERFEVKRVNNDSVKVEVFKINSDDEIEKKIYSRTFSSQVTKELWLYGLGGDDEFKIEGEVDESIKVRIVGGEGTDTFEDESRVKGWSHKTKIYDNPEDISEVKRSKETSTVASNNPWVNEFSRDDFEYDYFGPRLSFELNPDDGLFLGAGVYMERFGFRRDPQASLKVEGNFSTKTRGFNLKTEAKFYSLFAHNWDLEINAWGHNPKFAFNYFGQGNDSEFTQDLDYYRVRLSNIHVSTPLVKRFGKMFSFGIGPMYEYADVEEQPNTILENQIGTQFLNTFSKRMLGGKMFAELNYIDHPFNPTKGIRWNAEVSYLNEIDGDDVNFARLSTDFSLYYTPKLPFRLTFATRFGVSENVGDYLFHQSNFLGGQTNLRGFRRTRFAGKGSVYQNTEARVSLAKIKNVVLNGDFGVLGFVDNGKVWADDVEESTSFTTTYGGGAFLHFYEYIVLTAQYGITPDRKGAFYVNMGFFF